MRYRKRICSEIKIKDFSQIVLEMLASLNTVKKRQERLIEITADGVIDEDEIDDFIRIQDDLEKISITVHTIPNLNRPNHLSNAKGCGII